MRLDYSRQGPQSFVARSSGFSQPTAKSESIGFLNGQIGLAWQSTSLNFFVKNINNEKRAVNASILNGFVQSRPRTMGVDLIFEF